MGGFMRRSRYGEIVLLALLCVCIVLLAGRPVLAAEDKVSVYMIAGEHGTMNGSAGNHTESFETGTDVNLKIQAEEGYLIDSIRVNEEELEDSDANGVIGKRSGELTLGELEDDVTVEADFTEDPEPEGNVQEGETAQDQSEEMETREDGTQTDEKTGQDEAAAKSAENADGEADEDADEDAAIEDSDGSKERDSGKKGTTSSAYTGSGASPRTGDEIPGIGILLLAISLTLPGILACRYLQRRKTDSLM